MAHPVPEVITILNVNILFAKGDNNGVFYFIIIIINILNNGSWSCI